MNNHDHAGKIQDLLDEEAQLGNDKKYEERKPILVLIKLMRGPAPRPCWGEDDCSTMILMTCPWRIDCSSEEAEQWNNNTRIN